MNRKKPTKPLAIPLLGAATLLLIIFSSSADWKIVTHGDTTRHAVNEFGFLGAALYQVSQLPSKLLVDAQSLAADREPFIDFLAKSHAKIERHRSAHPRKKHVIYIQFESIDDLCVDRHYNGLEIMPFFNSIKKDGIYFSNAIDNTSAGRTTDGEFLALTSATPIPGRPVYVNYDLSKIPSLPKTLREEGYYTFSIHGFNGSFWNREISHHALGYERSFFLDDLDAADQIGWGISDRSIFDQAFEKIVDSNRPVFAHIILLTNHHPYNHVAKIAGTLEDDIHKNYIESVRYVDSAVASFHSKLASSGLLENSIVALYSDHDSGLQENLVNFLEISPKPSIHDKIPMLVLGLDSEPRIQEALVGLQDLPVIVLNDLGIPAPHTFTGNPHQLAGTTTSPELGMLSIENGDLKQKPNLIDRKNLTRLSILDPISLSIDEN